MPEDRHSERGRPAPISADYRKELRYDAASRGGSIMLLWRTVRVFVSSTFRDMHAERDHLVKVVFPALRERLEPHRVHLIDIDLRWGVTREQAENDQVLELCLRQIDDCRPFFIGILGERYGWVPEKLTADVVKGSFG